MQSFLVAYRIMAVSKFGSGIEKYEPHYGNILYESFTMRGNPIREIELSEIRTNIEQQYKSYYTRNLTILNLIPVRE